MEVVGSGLFVGVGAIGAITVFNDISGQNIMPIGFDILTSGKLAQPSLYVIFRLIHDKV